MIIELDCDGVLLDLGGAVENSKYGGTLKNNGLHFYDTKKYNFSDFPSEVRKDIFTAFKDPEVIASVKPYAMADTFLRGLAVHPSVKKIKLRSGICAEEVRTAKLGVLKSLIKEAVGDANQKFEIDLIVISDGAAKEAEEPDILVEDSAENLITSKARKKLLINQNYNSEEEYDGLREINYMRIDDLLDILDLL